MLKKRKNVQSGKLLVAILFFETTVKRRLTERSILLFPSLWEGSWLYVQLLEYPRKTCKYNYTNKLAQGISDEDMLAVQKNFLHLRLIPYRTKLERFTLSVNPSFIFADKLTLRGEAHAGLHSKNRPLERGKVL
jgi:hypothetical protein